MVENKKYLLKSLKIRNKNSSKKYLKVNCQVVLFQVHILSTNLNTRKVFESILIILNKHFTRLPVAFLFDL